MIALFSDIHSNAVAFEAVLKDMSTLGVSSALCLGDTIGYGPDPGRCVELVREQCVASVLGNHEAMLLALDGLQGLNEAILAPLVLAKEQLEAGALNWIRQLPIAIDLDAFEIVHASHYEPPAFHYVRTTEEAACNFSAQNHAVSFHGHTHVPAIWERSETGKVRCYAALINQALRLDPDRKYSIDIGSVGQPRNGDPRASYAVYDYATGTLLHRRVAYDLDEACKRFRRKGIPRHNQLRLRKGR